MKTPLAWLQLSHEKVRLLVALAGIGFADMLMFMQLGFQNALFDSSVVLHKAFDGDIFLMSPQSDALGFTETFSSRRLYESLAVDGVESVVPVYLNFGVWKNPLDRNTRTIFVIGYNPSNNVLDLPGLEENIDKVKLADFVLFDDKSREEFGAISELFQQQESFTTEISSRRVTVGGLFSLGTSFAADGSVITSDLNFLRMFSERERGLIDLGVINLEPDANLDLALAQLRKKLPQDVNVFSKEEFIQYEKKLLANWHFDRFCFYLRNCYWFCGRDSDCLPNSLY